MAGVDSFLQLLTIVSIVGILISFIIRVSIQALFLKFFTKRAQLSESYGKAWLAILIPSIILSIIVIPLIIIGLSDLFIAIAWILFFPILLFSIKFVYNTDMQTSTSISFKYFLLILAIVLIAAGAMTLIGGVASPLESNVPQSVCTLDCQFAYSLKDFQEGSLFVKGYNIPAGGFENRENYVIGEQIFSEEELNIMKAGWQDVNGNDRIYGELGVNGCNWMSISRSSPSSGGSSCQESSRSFFTNLKKIVVG